MSLSKITLPSQVILIVCVIFWRYISYDESIFHTGIIATNATSILCNKIAFSDGTVSSSFISSTNLPFSYRLLIIIFSFKLLGCMEPVSRTDIPSILMLSFIRSRSCSITFAWAKIFLYVSSILINQATDSSYDFRLTNLNKNPFMGMKIIALYQFVPVLLLKNNLYDTAIIPPLKNKVLEILPMNLLQELDCYSTLKNNNSYTTVCIVRQRIPFGGLIMSILISFVEITILHAYLPTDVWV